MRRLPSNLRTHCERGLRREVKRLVRLLDTRELHPPIGR